MTEECRLGRSIRAVVPTPKDTQTVLNSLSQLPPLVTGEQVWENLPNEVKNAVDSSHVRSFIKQMSRQIENGKFTGSELLQMDEHCVKSTSGTVKLVTGRLNNILAGCEDD